MMVQEVAEHIMNNKKFRNTNPANPNILKILILTVK